MSVHNPNLTRNKSPFQPTTWTLVCPCGGAPTRKLAHDEARDEMKRHPVEQTAEVSS